MAGWGDRTPDDVGLDVPIDGYDRAVERATVPGLAVGPAHHDPGARRATFPDLARGPEVVVWEAPGLVDGRVGYGHAIAHRLTQDGFGVRTVPLVERVPDDLEMTAPVHILSGGNTAVDANVPWLAAARSRLAIVLDWALDGHATLTGICFGSQLIANLVAGGGAVGPHPAGMQAGLVDVRDTDDDTDHVASSFHYHRIRREALERSGAKLVFHSERTDVQAYVAGLGVHGVQFHPELSPRLLATALRSNRWVLERYGASVTDAAATVRAARRRWSEELWQRFVHEPATRMLHPDPGTP